MSAKTVKQLFMNRVAFCLLFIALEICPFLLTLFAHALHCFCMLSLLGQYTSDVVRPRGVFCQFVINPSSLHLKSILRHRIVNYLRTRPLNIFNNTANLQYDMSSATTVQIYLHANSRR